MRDMESPFAKAVRCVRERLTMRARGGAAHGPTRTAHRAAPVDLRVSQPREARKRARAEVAARGTIADVGLARVIICDESRAAYALRYEEGDRAPTVLASGEGPMAERMLREARRFGLAVVHDAEVARALAEVAAGETIPETLYDPVAAILRNEAE